jgi:hypothetical protein
MSLLGLKPKGAQTRTLFAQTMPQDSALSNTANKEQGKIPRLRLRIISALFWGALLTIGTLEKSRIQESENRSRNE